MITSAAIVAFKNNTAKQTELARVLKLDIVQEALSLIADANEPKDVNKMPTIVGLNPDCVVSREYSRMYGVNEALKTFRNLINPPPPKPERIEPAAEFAQDLPDPPDLRS